ncbi:hypothetical protein JW979_11570 [bacterium]|nr:hypothetical protein [candidate division CSSED10-310 bacterium]
MEIKKLVGNTWLGIESRIIQDALSVDQHLSEQIHQLKKIKEETFNEKLNAVDTAELSPKLFGTSGIRGEYNPSLLGNPFELLIKENMITPKLAYFFGRAAGNLMRDLRIKDPVWVIMDPRESSFCMALTLMRGLLDEGISLEFGGVASTPCYSLNRSGVTIVITASHNPVQYNGIKVFWSGRPLVIKMEENIENRIQALSICEMESCFPEPNRQSGTLSVNILEIERRHFSALQNLLETARLRIEQTSRLEMRFLPLDLAFGAAACPVTEDGTISRISPTISVFLCLGIPIIGYGCVRSPQKMNYKIGAAYAYGETPEQPQPGELSKFSQGMPGYGANTRRILFLPDAFAQNNATLKTQIETYQECEHFQRIPIGYTDFKTMITIVHIDHPNINNDLLTEIESEFLTRQPLPGLMVDGDADRLLITAPDIAKQEIPFLTGDAMLRLLTYIIPSEKFTEVVFTVESSIVLEKALRLRKQQLLAQENKTFSIRIVNVGDRSIIDYFLDRGQGSLLGGEPSGHIIFGDTKDNEIMVIDDPFIAYLRVLEGLASERFDLDRVVGRMFWDLPEIYCARKPDAYAGNGISIAEKQALVLWESIDEPSRLSAYAKAFIPNYIKMFGDAYGRAFVNGINPELVFTWEWERLLEGKLQTKDWDDDLPVAQLIYGTLEVFDELYVGLHIDRRSWAGPDIIWLRFWLRPEGEPDCLMGEGVFRNSGTAPKNAGYHKLWPNHPKLNVSLSETLLRDILDDLAQKRAQWTDTYVQEKLR